VLVTDADSGSWRPGTPSFLAAPAALHAPLSALLSPLSPPRPTPARHGA
jgi:hypothetical protein